MFSFDSVTVKRGAKTIVTGASAQCRTGELTALVGPNGAGKSTLLQAIAGILPGEGHVLLDDNPMTGKERRDNVAYMPQDTGAQSSLTLLEVILLGRINSLGLSLPEELVAQAEAALDQFGLAGLQNRALDEVSGGQRQLVYLAQALFSAPRVLLLDEPTAALDLRHQLVVLQAVRRYASEHGIVVIMAIHDLSLAAQFADQIICLDHGRIDGCGKAEEVFTTARLRDLYGVEAEIEKLSSGRLHISAVNAIPTDA